MKLLAGPYFNEQEAHQKESSFYDRAFRPDGVTRQMLAIQTRKSTHEDLLRVSKEHHIPALVLHGKLDALIPPKRGEETANSIEGAKFVVVEEMGHDFPKALIPQIINEICSVILPSKN